MDWTLIADDKLDLMSHLGYLGIDLFLHRWRPVGHKKTFLTKKCHNKI